MSARTVVINCKYNDSVVCIFLFVCMCVSILNKILNLHYVKKYYIIRMMMMMMTVIIIIIMTIITDK